MPHGLRHTKKQPFIALLLILLVGGGAILSSGYKPNAGNDSAYKNFADSGYAGAAACIGCHKAIYDSFTATSHYITSRPASAEFIKGSFEKGENFFSYNPFMNVQMENKDGRFFQTSYINGEPIQSEAIDIVVGSGKKGQTYLYWKQNLMYQLPVSYHVPSKSWCNSPGYPPGMPRYNRLIPGRCLECHGSKAVIEDVGNNIHNIDRNSIVYGVDCERCHGPSADHVAYHSANPKNTISKHTLGLKKLSRQQNLDLCALCHSGFRTQIKPVFTYKAGDKLNDFLLSTYHSDSATTPDVHGNQYELLTASKCFQNSQMTCSSCHNPHNNEADNTGLFSQRCISCHNSAANSECKIKNAGSLSITENCIDCHMPLQPSKAIFLQLQDPAKSTPDYVRTHRVAIYTDATKDFIKKLKQKNKN
jgi:hypothetical protein